MESEYWLRRAAIGPQELVPIAQERYEALRLARQTLIDVAAFEHRYELLIGNYFAFEQFCMETSFRGAIEMDHRHETWAKVFIEANRHLMNLLTAVRSYADHVVRGFKHFELTPDFQDAAEAQLSIAYDSSLAYRVFWEMRNHVQHRDVPVHGFSTNFRGKGEAESLVVRTSKEKLLDGGKFKLAVLSECDEVIDIRKVAREYMNAASKVQVSLRALVAERVDSDRKLIEGAIADFVSAQPTKEPGKPGVGLTICRQTEGKFVDSHPILLDWDDARLLLAQKNAFELTL